MRKRQFVAVLLCATFVTGSLAQASDQWKLPYSERLNYYLDQIRGQGLIRFWWRTRPQKLEPARNRAISVRVSELVNKLLIASYPATGDSQVLIGPPRERATREEQFLFFIIGSDGSHLPDYVDDSFILQLAEDETAENDLQGVFGHSLPTHLAPVVVADLIELYQQLSHLKPEAARIRILARFATSQFWNRLIPSLNAELTWIIKQEMFNNKDPLTWLSTISEIDFIAAKHYSKPEFTRNVVLVNKLKAELDRFGEQLRVSQTAQCIRLIGQEGQGE